MYNIIEVDLGARLRLQYSQLHGKQCHIIVMMRFQVLSLQQIPFLKSQLFAPLATRR